CYVTPVTAASFLRGSCGHPQAQTVPSAPWAAPCPVVTPSLPGLARRFLPVQYTTGLFLNAKASCRAALQRAFGPLDKSKQPQEIQPARKCKGAAHRGHHHCAGREGAVMSHAAGHGETADGGRRA